MDYFHLPYHSKYYKSVKNSIMHMADLPSSVSDNSMYLIRYQFRALVGPGRFGFIDRSLIYDRQNKVGCDLSDIVTHKFFNFNPETFSIIPEHQIKRIEEYLNGDRIPKGEIPVTESLICDKFFSVIELPQEIVQEIRPKLLAAKNAKTTYDDSIKSLSDVVLTYQKRFLTQD